VPSWAPRVRWQGVRREHSCNSVTDEQRGQRARAAHDPEGCPFSARSSASFFARKALLLSLITPCISSRKRTAALHTLALRATNVALT